MSKGYWVATVDVADPAGMKQYSAANSAVLARYGARFVAVRGRQRPVEGTPRAATTIVEFPSYEAAVSCYDDPEYQRAAALRHACAQADMVIVEGFEPPR